MPRSNKSLILLAMSLVAGFATAACRNTPTTPGEAPVAKATVGVLNLQTTDPYEEFDAACQTSGLMEFRAWDATGESGVTGEPVVLEWSFLVDRGRGFEPAPDWGGPYVFVEGNTDKPMQDRTLVRDMLTIGHHQVTLTVRTRDGRQSSKTLNVFVTSCESCGV